MISTSSNSATLDGSSRIQSAITSNPDAKSPSSLGRLVVLTGPSGVGKGTLIQALLQRHPELRLSVSATTRSPRPGEVHGKNYYFLTPEEFKQLVDQDALLEWAEFAGNCYGTPRAPVVAHVQQGHMVILEIELEGARQVRQSFPGALQVFIMPPSIDALAKRLHSRDQDSKADIQRRLQRAEAEIQAASEFDVQIVNDDFQKALTQLEEVLID